MRNFMHKDLSTQMTRHICLFVCVCMFLLTDNFGKRGVHICQEFSLIPKTISREICLYNELSQKTSKDD